MSCDCCRRTCAGYASPALEGTFQAGMADVNHGYFSGIPLIEGWPDPIPPGVLVSLTYKEVFTRYDSLTDLEAGEADGVSFSASVDSLREWVGDDDGEYDAGGIPMTQTTFASWDDPEWVFSWEETGAAPVEAGYYFIFSRYEVVSSSFATVGSVTTGPVSFGPSLTFLAESEKEYQDGGKTYEFKSGSVSATVSVDWGKENPATPDEWDCSGVPLDLRILERVYATDGSGDFVQTPVPVDEGGPYSYSGFPDAGSSEGLNEAAVELQGLQVCLCHCRRIDAVPTV